MNAALVSVGSELLAAGRADTNAEWIGARLGRAGLTLESRCAVIDEPHAIAAVLRAAIARVALVVVTGGLGPTDDDCTREGLALAL
ncbi:MAG TPA: molybdopterin-binding protein, partial [Candidatus Polarisedimenticolaceae bacterium]|nr:molybdopterin-binding protein [Candidatus Polarisedimenticolaceae bacterium]